MLELARRFSRRQSEVGRNQREHFLREQMKAIQKELGEGDDQTKEIEELSEKIEAAGMPESVKKEALRELDRPEDAGGGGGIHGDAHLSRLAGCLAVVETDRRGDRSPHTKAVLDHDHSGLAKVKDRILEFAVRKLNPNVKGLICARGLPGVGKTSSPSRLRSPWPEVRAGVARRHAR